MLIYLLLAATFLIAIFSIILAGTSVRKGNISLLLLSLSIALFIYLYGTWVYLSIYTRYVFAAAFLIYAAIVLLRKKRGTLFITVLPLLPAALFMLLAVLYYTGTTGKPEIVQLRFPLKKGTYFILQGGKGLPANFFHYSYRGAIYAIDIVRLNKFGNRAGQIASSRLENYYIFNDTVYSPCDGIIGRANDEHPDNVPPARTRGNINAILIENDSFYVFLGHLKQGGALVKEGDRVKTGDPVGLVGNSGFSLEPHLHIQAHLNSGTGRPWYRERPLYIAFDGRTYLLFEVIRPRKVTMVPE